MHLLAGQGGIIGAVPCTSGFLHRTHSTYPVSCGTFQFFILSVTRQLDKVPQDGTNALCIVGSTKEQAGHRDQEHVLGFGQEMEQCIRPSTKSVAKHAAQVAAKPAALLAAGEPMPMAPVEHVHLFRVKYSRQKKWHTESVSQ